MAIPRKEIIKRLHAQTKAGNALSAAAPVLGTRLKFAEAARSGHASSFTTPGRYRKWPGPRLSAGLMPMATQMLLLLKWR